VYPDKGEQTADQGDGYMRYATDRGDSWCSPIRINDDSGDHDQWCPSMAMKPDGSELFVGFYDRRCNSTNTLIHTFGRIGTPSASGITFDPSFQISDSSFSHETDNGKTPMTDYDTAAAGNEYFYYAWTDKRHPYEYSMVITNESGEEETNYWYKNEMDIRFVKIK
jgi:hypothetical protein